MREVDVMGVRVEMPSNQPIVLLRETNGTRYLPIWVGAVEAQAIAAALDGVEFPRPLTHDLLKSVVEALGASVERVVLTKLDGDARGGAALSIRSVTVFPVSSLNSAAWGVKTAFPVVVAGPNLPTARIASASMTTGRLICPSRLVMVFKVSSSLHSAGPTTTAVAFTSLKVSRTSSSCFASSLFPESGFVIRTGEWFAATSAALCGATM